jgi:hypothetical protein
MFSHNAFNIAYGSDFTSIISSVNRFRNNLIPLPVEHVVMPERRKRAFKGFKQRCYGHRRIFG